MANESKEFKMELGSREQAEKKKILTTPIKHLDLEQTSTIADLLDGMEGMSIQARNLNHCAQVFEAMLTDEGRPTILLGIAGPLIAGGLRKVIRDMIAFNMVDVVVSTGAILYQDVYQARGYQHYKGTPTADDAELRDLYIDRIYDTYVDEQKFWETDIWLGHFADSLPPGNASTRQFLAALGAHINDDQSILATAAKHGVPVFAPAINDSSIGIGLTDHYHRMKKAGRQPFTISSIQDNYELTQVVVKSPMTAAIYIAGGVPKNYINDSVVMSYIFGEETGGHTYAFQVTTDVPHWGGLSGSTLKEASSWGKINPKANTAMAFVEPTVSLPLLVGCALQKKLSADRSRLRLEWDGDILKTLEAAVPVGR